VTLTRDGFLVDDMPEVAATHVENWRKKGDGDDTRHILNLKNKIANHHAAIMRALKKIPKYENQLWAMEQLVQQKEEAVQRREAKSVEKAKRLERERIEKMQREEKELEDKKARSKPLPPMNRKRASSDEGSDAEEKHKKRTPKKKPQVEPEKKEPARNPPKVYKPLSQKEWDLWYAFVGYSENEWRYSIEHGTEAMERLVCRGANHLVPEIEPGQRTPWIEPPAFVLVPVPVAPHVRLQEAAAEALPPLPDSPVSDGMGQAMSSLNL